MSNGNGFANDPGIELEKRIASLFSGKGWDARLSGPGFYETGRGRVTADIILFYDGKPVGAVETKLYKGPLGMRKAKDTVEIYAKRAIGECGLSFFMLFVNASAFVYSDGEFKETSVIPTPEDYLQHRDPALQGSDETLQRALALIYHIDASDAPERPAVSEDAKIFISYKSEEHDIALTVKEALIRKGYTCWMAPESIEMGKNYLSAIPKAIKGCKAFVFIFTERSQNSGWCQDEVVVARNRNKLILPYKPHDFEINDEFELLFARVQTKSTLEDLFASLRMYGI